MRLFLFTAAWLPCLLALTACQPSTPPAPVVDAAERDAPALPGQRGARVAPHAPARATEAPDETRLTAAVSPGALSPGNVVRRYVTAVLQDDTAAMDRYWQLPTRGGRPADDAALHALRQVRTLRVTADTPVPRDERQPSALLEVPVRIHAVTAQGDYTFRGWYRLVPDRDRSAWLIQSAQLQPVLD